MNYELAKQLKEAGFPQDILHYQGKDVGLKIMSLDANSRSLHRDNPLYFPTLEELIDACGEAFRAVEYSSITKEWTGAANFYAVINGKTFLRRESANGSTSTEAVARLWLAMQLQRESRRIT
jgi:hypothetical protein